MARPRTEPQRSQTNLRLPVEMLARLHAEADARDVSVNWLVTHAVADFLERLIPVDEWKITR